MWAPGPYVASSSPGLYERADGEREAAAPDASGEVVAQPLQEADLFVEPRPPLRRELGPVLAVGGAPLGQRSQGVADLGEAEPDPLGGLDEGDAAQHVGVVLTMTGGRALGVDQALVLVEPQRRRRDAGASCDRPDRKHLDFNHASSLTVDRS